MRRLLDLVASSLGLILFSPFLILAAIAIKLDSPGPVFHRAERVGRGGMPFRLFKFRSMHVGAAQAGPGITRQGDPRVTRLGRFLRRTKLDELPQLLNVVKGEMSLVGPRPEDPRYVALYTPEQRHVLDFSPGITSAASLRFRDEEALLAAPDWEEKYRQEILPEKLRLDLEYMRRRTLFTDLALIARTLLAIID